MEAETYSNVRNNLKHFMRKVNEDVEPVIITSKNNDENAILISKKEYDNLVENAYIRSSQANIDHIMQSWAELKEGKGAEHKWE